MDTTKQYKRFLENTIDYEYLQNELKHIEGDKDAINDRFWRELSFGTGGLRGEIGAGTNRMNIFTVGKATQGLANYLKQTFENPSVAIAYDTRNFSLEFANCATDVFTANGIKVYYFDGVRPTPMLSFAVRHTNASAGIVITASHNPKEYNGYKVYGQDGGQITDEAAKAITEQIKQVDLFSDVKTTSNSSTTAEAIDVSKDVDKAYYEKVKGLTIRKQLIKDKADSISILYSPLHGSGNIPVRHMLKELGYKNVDVVSEQELPDGNFPTTSYPNPEEPDVYKLAIEKASKTNPDLIFATDPDCDRIGVLVKDKSGKFSVLTGNQVGALLCDYIIRSHIEAGTMPQNPAIIKTIVTSDMGKVICEKNNVNIYETLTGFKYIGELVGMWQENHDHSFLLGFEESYGYLSGDFVRDKDAVIAAVLISEMALWYKDQDLSLFDAMENLYKKYGYFKEKLISVTMKGQEGSEKIKSIIDNLRTNYNEIFNNTDIVRVEDYGLSVYENIVSKENGTLDLPKSNVLKFIFADGSWLVFRPSGTEPKIKVYLAARSGNMNDCSDRLSELNVLIEEILG